MTEYEICKEKDYGGIDQNRHLEQIKIHDDILMCLEWVWSVTPRLETDNRLTKILKNLIERHHGRRQLLILELATKPGNISMSEAPDFTDEEIRNLFNDHEESTEENLDEPEPQPEN